MRNETHLPCGRLATTTILGVRFCERCAREQENDFAVGEFTHVPRGKSGGTGGAWCAARAPRSGYPADPRGSRRGPVARSAKASLLLVVAVLSVFAAACGGAGQSRGGTDATEAKVEPETTAREDARPAEATVGGNESREVVARAGGADGAVARAGDAVARAGEARVRADEAGREKGGDETSAKNSAGENRSRMDHPQKTNAGRLTLTVGGDRGTSFSGVCSVGEKEKTIAGRVPERYVFEPGDAGLECEIRKKDGGALELVVAGEGLRSVQQTAASGGTIRFSFSGGGISSSTSSISLNQTTRSSD